jgi:hypothetical protein
MRGLIKMLWRIKIAFQVLFIHKHFVIISMRRQEGVNQLKGENYEMQIEYIGLQKYNAVLLIKHTAENFDDTDVVLLKAKFEADVESRSL